MSSPDQVDLKMYCYRLPYLRPSLFALVAFSVALSSTLQPSAPLLFPFACLDLSGCIARTPKHRSLCHRHRLHHNSCLIPDTRSTCIACTVPTMLAFIRECAFVTVIRTTTKRSFLSNQVRFTS
ncbi:hypothetical protein BDV27DRAFT_42734 [Aspergillus caelatus]|uniref:Uncharacterized protein n=1 Tax=Aspergillus caelatus TaxID=61420 RepID=A0A5N7AH35_9EURO|nr:uncharacterized protein BDV27DRAFT_42734 [Aspergillus caelatus]KAE8368476.1 hypothetical protein BDV27DRAFT_42734 [Aspergillus caelatus]